jgi:hypothetical protein
MTEASRSIRLATLVAALLVTSAPAVPAFAQGQTRTLEDLVAEYRAQCGKNGSRERLLVAFDRAIRATKDRKRIMLLNRRRALVANPQAPVCPPTPLPVTRPAGNVPLPPAAPATPGTDTAEDACARPAPNPRAADCKRLQAILGRWTARKYGGVIELVLTPNGTISGWIVASNKPMSDYGYTAGTQIFRGYRCRFNNLAWPVLCEGGEALITSQPNNKYKEPFSVREWKKSGLVVLNKGDPAVLGHPLDARLANYASWIRTGGGQ